MRLLERTLKTLFIAPGLTRTDGMGGVERFFSAERPSVRASLIPTEGALERCEPGLVARRKCLMLAPKDAEIAPGDGVAETETGEPEWLCVDVREWQAHVAAMLERRRWP